MPVNSFGPDDQRDEDDYGEEYGWWDEYEDALEDESFYRS